MGNFYECVKTPQHIGVLTALVFGLLLACLLPVVGELHYFQVIL